MLAPTVAFAQDVPDGPDSSSPTADTPKPDREDMKDDAGRPPANAIGDPDYAKTFVFNSAAAQKATKLMQAIRAAIAACDRKAYDAAVQALRDYQSIGFELENDPLANPDNVFSSGQTKGKTAAEIQKMKDDYVKQYKAMAPRSRRTQRNNGTLDIGTATTTSYDQWETLEFDLIRIRRLRPPPFPENCEPKTSETPPGTGTGGEKPGKPTDPPKAPSDSPDGQGMLPGGIKLEFSAGAQLENWRPISIGSFPSGSPFLQSAGAGTGFNFGVNVMFPLRRYPTPTPSSRIDQAFEQSWAMYVSASYSETSASASGSGAGTNLVFISPFVVTNSPMGQADAVVRTTKQNFVFEVAVQPPHQPFLPDTLLGGNLTANIGLRYERTHVSHDATMTSMTFPGEQHRLTLNTTDNYFGPRIYMGIMWDRGPWTFGVNHSSVLALRFTDASARQDSVIPGFVPSTFGIEIEKSRTGFAYIGQFNANAGYAITPNFLVGVRGGIKINSAESHWRVPSLPGDTTQLRTSAQVSGTIGAYLRIRY